MATITQRYNKVIMDIAMKRKGIDADSLQDLTEKDWEILIENAGGDETFARQAVYGYFDGSGSEYLESMYYDEE